MTSHHNDLTFRPITGPDELDLFNRLAYLGVLPAHRGHGYIADILAEGTRVLAAQDVPFIKASTDLGNVPMAAAFHRAGWVATEHQIDMTWDAPG